MESEHPAVSGGAAGEPARQVGPLPSGTVTFLFTDIEGSTELLQRLREEYLGMLSIHHQLLERAIEGNGGTVVETEGDGVFAAFPKAPGALQAALDALRALLDQRWPDGVSVKVRMGLHSGEGNLFRSGYWGIDVHRAARIASAAHGGQLLLSDSTRGLIEHALPEGVQIRDMGRHRMKGLAQPEHLHQAVATGLPDDFSALKTLEARPNNLPAQLTSFVGRHKELAQVGQLLRDHRLVTLTGPGGAGKTRLSLEAALNALDDFEDGAFFVPLASVADPAMVLSVIAEALGVREQADQPLVSVLLDFLREKHLLLVLDNLEQVMDAVPDISNLLAGASKIRVLATSREVLRIAGEAVFTVPSLSLPPSTMSVSRDAVFEHEAVRLFVERARAVQRGFDITDVNAATVAEICTRLDGLPLTIELAAARLRLFSLEELKDRLERRLDVLRRGPRDLATRHQTLRNAIEWSYELLNADERAVFQLLSVFAPTRVDTVNDVAHKLERFGDIAVVDHVESLVDKSLLRLVEHLGRSRLTMLDTIREFAAERLDEGPDFAAAARKSHAEYFAIFAQTSSEQLSGPARAEMLDGLRADLANLTTAWRFWVTACDVEKLDMMFESLWVLFEADGRYRAATEIANDLLVLMSAVPSTPEHLEEMITLAMAVARGLLAIYGYTEEVEAAYNSALALVEKAGSVPQRFPVLRALASFHLDRGNFPETRAKAFELLELAKQQDRERAEAIEIEGHLLLGISLLDAHAQLDHLDRAIALFDPRRHAPGRYRLGPSSAVVCYTTSAFFLSRLGYPHQARDRATRAIELARDLDHPYSLSYALFHSALLELWQRDFTSVEHHASAVLAIAEEYDYSLWKALADTLLGATMAGLDRHDEGIARIEEGLATFRLLNGPPVFWPFLISIKAAVLGEAGRFEEGVQLVDQAIAIAMQWSDEPTIFAPEGPLLKGDLLLGLGDLSGADAHYRMALDLARATSARTSELRAATRLAQLARAARDDSDERTTLRAIYEWFTEGHDVQDLVDARAVLGGAGSS